MAKSSIFPQLELTADRSFTATDRAAGRYSMPCAASITVQSMSLHTVSPPAKLDKMLIRVVSLVFELRPLRWHYAMHLRAASCVGNGSSWVKEYQMVPAKKSLLMGVWRRGHYTESLVYFSTLISSSLFHACNQDIYTGTAVYRSSHQLSSNVSSLDCPCSLPTLVTLYIDKKE